MITWRHVLGTALREGPCVLTLGNFDGVHIGHQALIGRAKSSAKALNVPLVAVTFDPHPTKIVSPHYKSKLLMTLHQRLYALSSLGVDLTWVVPFTCDVAKLAPLAFLSEIHRALSPIELYVGCGFRFGSGRHGSFDGLKNWSTEVGCRLNSHFLEFYGSDSVSSTRIRRALNYGEVELASALLGRPYSLTGDIILSDNVGCSSNDCAFDLNWRQEQLPREGIYITEVSLDSDSDCLLGLTDVSKRLDRFESTNAGITVSTKLLNFDDRALVNNVELRFLHYLRDIKNQIDIDDVMSQSVRDAASASDWYLKYKRLH